MMDVALRMLISVENGDAELPASGGMWDDSINRTATLEPSFHTRDGIHCSVMNRDICDVCCSNLLAQGNSI
jgi:hypothetical protein